MRTSVYWLQDRMTEKSSFLNNPMKVIVVGDLGVGKTTLLLRYTNDRVAFDNTFETTLTVYFSSKIVDVSGVKVKLQLWDTFGQEYRQTMAKGHYRNAVGIVMVFDLTRTSSFENIQRWLNQVHEHAGEDVDIVLVGNKVDLAESRAIDHETASSLAQTIGAMYVECSAKTGANVNLVFTSLASKLANRVPKREIMIQTNMGDNVMKVILVGDWGVGKTSLLLRYVNDTFNQSCTSTIGVDFSIRRLDVKGVRVKMILWDTAGQDRFRHILSSFYRGANGLGFVFDLTNMESFQSVNRWVQVAQQCGAECRVKMLVGNKADLKHVVSRDAALSLATAIGAKYIETSAKEATNVQQVFTNMAEMWVDQLQEQGVLAEFQRPAVSISAHNVQGYGCLGSDSCSTL